MDARCRAFSRTHACTPARHAIRLGLARPRLSTGRGGGHAGRGGSVGSMAAAAPFLEVGEYMPPAWASGIKMVGSSCLDHPNYGCITAGRSIVPA
eukprot:162077-Chlamydomonas_euryale.AAC.2